jgi:hypothetical protein
MRSFDCRIVLTRDLVTSDCNIKFPIYQNNTKRVNIIDDLCISRIILEKTIQFTNILGKNLYIHKLIHSLSEQNVIFS